MHAGASVANANWEWARDASSAWGDFMKKVYNLLDNVNQMLHKKRGTMAKTTLITARLDPELKRATENILKQLGLTHTQAITMFYRQINMRRGLPFEVNIPNAETQQAIADAVNRQNTKSFETVDEAFKELGI